MATTYRISSQNTTLGIYEANSADEALDVMARDAGYDSHAAACETTETDADDWTTSRREFERGSVGLFVEEIEPQSIDMAIETSRSTMDPTGLLSDAEFAAYESAYFEAVCDAVRAAYPDVECEFTLVGHGGRDSVCARGFDSNREVESACDGIMSDVWDAQDFWTETPATVSA